MRDTLALILGGGQGTPALPAHPAPIEARGADRRQVPAHRRADQQLPARRPAAHLRAHAVQLGVAQPARRRRLSDGHVLQRLRRDPGRRADAREHRVVPGHGRRGPQGGPALRPVRRRLLPDSGRRSPVPHGLRAAARRAPRSPRRHHHRGAAGGRRRGRRHGHLPLRRPRRDPALRGEAVAGSPGRDRPQLAGELDVHARRRATSRSWRRWASTSSPATCCSICWRANTAWTSAAS